MTGNAGTKGGRSDESRAPGAGSGPGHWLVTIALVLSCSFVPSVSGQDSPVTLAERTVLKSSPFGGARTVATLDAGTRVQVIQSASGWLRVRESPGAKGRTGWIRASAVQGAQGSKPRGGSGFFSSLADLSRRATSLFSAGRGAPAYEGGTATIGIRGLNAEELTTATPDPEQVKKLEGFGVPSKDARRHAKRAGLSARRVDYLEPASASASRPAAVEAEEEGAQ